MTPFRLEPVRLAVREDSEGLLVYAGGVLAAVLVQLGSLHGAQQGLWFLEAGFGALDGPNRPTFLTLDEAQSWIARRMGVAPAL